MDLFSKFPAELLYELLATCDAQSFANLTFASPSVFRTYTANPKLILKQLIDLEDLEDIKTLIWMLTEQVSTQRPAPDRSSAQHEACPELPQPLRALSQFAGLASEIDNLEKACMHKSYRYLHESLDAVYGLYERSDGAIACRMSELSAPIVMHHPKKMHFSHTERLRVRRALWRIKYLNYIVIKSPHFCIEARTSAADARTLVKNTAKSQFDPLSAWEVDEMITVYELIGTELFRRDGKYAPKYIRNNYIAVREMQREYCGLEFLELHLMHSKELKSGLQALKCPAFGWLYCLMQETVQPDRLGPNFPLINAYLQMGVAIWDRSRWVEREMISPSWPDDALVNKHLATFPNTIEDVKRVRDVPSDSLRSGYLETWALLDRSILDVDTAMLINTDEGSEYDITRCYIWNKYDNGARLRTEKDNYEEAWSEWYNDEDSWERWRHMKALPW